MATALSIISTIATIGGSVLSGVMAQQQAEAQAQNEEATAAAARYQADVQKVNAQISRDNAVRSVQTAQIQQQEQDYAARAQIGSIIAEQGASGLSLGGRSQVATRKSAAMLARKDALNIRYAGEVEKYNYLTEAYNQEAGRQLTLNEALSHERAAENARTAGKLGLLSGFIGGFSSLVSAANPFKKGAGTASYTGTPYGPPASLAL